MVKRTILTLLIAGSAAQAQVEQLVQPGAEGEDSAPYSFLPTLVRGERDTNWIFSASDAGFDHSFRTFVRFPLPAPPEGLDVSYAYAWFYYAFDASGFGASEEVAASFSCHAVLEDWSEATLTWLQQPAFGDAFDAASGIDGFQLFYCDVTELVRAWQSGEAPNFGIALVNPTPRTIGMHSFESTLAPSDDYKPSLLIGYDAVGAGATDADRVVAAASGCLGAAGSDADGDEIPDACDVCPTAFDPEQDDADGDGEGDRCGFAAADLNSNGRVSKKDAKRFRKAIAASAKGRPFDLRCDLDASGTATAADRALWEPIYRAWLGKQAPR
jgi:hypothetical protein